MWIIGTRNHVLYECKLNAQTTAREYMVRKYERKILNGFRVRLNGRAYSKTLTRVNESADVLGMIDIN